MRVLGLNRVRAIYEHHFHNRRRERLFVASTSFAITFATVRGITHAIRSGQGPFHNVSAGNRHIHHLVPGILLLELAGYLWLNRWGIGGEHASPIASNLISAVYGSASALTMDEFALWLNLEDVYWAREGRESIDAVVLMGALLSVAFWGRPFLHAVIREALRPLPHHHDGRNRLRR